MKNVWRKYKEYFWWNDSADMHIKIRKKKKIFFLLRLFFLDKSKFFKYK